MRFGLQEKAEPGCGGPWLGHAIGLSSHCPGHLVTLATLLSARSDGEHRGFCLKVDRPKAGHEKAGHRALTGDRSGARPNDATFARRARATLSGSRKGSSEMSR